MVRLFKNTMQSSSFSSFSSLSSFVGAFPRLGFSGSRLRGSGAAASCLAFLPAAAGFSAPVGVGCARGVDALVRGRFPAAEVFRVQAPVSRGAFAARSARLVRWVASGSGLLVAFPAGAAPAGLRPSQRFAGHGSGTWGSVALALGLGAAVLVVVPAAADQGFPAPAAVAARFRLAGPAPCGGSLWLAPAVAPSLF